MRVLMIATSHAQLGDTNKLTGAWLEELSSPYYVFKEAGGHITVASPLGGEVPLDPKSQSIIVATQSTKRFLKDPEAIEFFSTSIPLEQVRAEDFDLVFLPGGHGPMWDMVNNSSLKLLLQDFNLQNKPIGSVCHGVVGLLSLQNNGGELLIKGKQLTSFSNSEEESARLTSVVPFLLETELGLAGALFSKGANYVSYVVADGNIITGQNPASSEEVAKKMVALFHHNSFISKRQSVLTEEI